MHIQDKPGVLRGKEILFCARPCDVPRSPVIDAARHVHAASATAVSMDFVVDARPENEPLAPSAEGAPSRKRRRKRSGNAARERMLASLVFSEGGASAAIEEADADAFGAAAAASDGEGDEGLAGGEQPSGGESGGEEEAEEEGEEEAEEEEKEEGH